MSEYHKIHSVWKRDAKGRIVEGEYSRPEFAYLRHCVWTATEKVDGTNIRVLWDGESIRFAGKTDNAQLPTPLVARLRELFHDPGAFRMVFGADVAGHYQPACIYGEGYGAKIQKGGGLYKSDGRDFVIFDIRVGGWWLRRDDVADVARALGGIDTVPEVALGSLPTLCDMARRGVRSTWGEFAAEGLVMRPSVELRARNGERIIAKIKTRDYLPSEAELSAARGPQPGLAPSGPGLPNEA